MGLEHPWCTLGTVALRKRYIAAIHSAATLLRIMVVVVVRADTHNQPRIVEETVRLSSALGTCAKENQCLSPKTLCRNFAL